MLKKITDIRQLQLLANTIRQDIIEMLAEAGSGHTAGPLGMADIFTALYFNVMKHDPKNWDWPERDILILSNGHICAVRYACMARTGYFPLSELKTFRKLSSRLQGHPSRKDMPALESSGGPLGLGLSTAIGFAMAFKMDGKKNHVFCAMSDGEHEEGQTWEAVMFAGNRRLDNITAIMDRNNIQIDGFTEDIMPLEPLRKKYESFGWRVIEADGHNMKHVIDALEEAKTIHEKPTMIIAHTIPGKGVSFTEHKYEWHGKAPNQKEAEKALKELREERKKITKSRRK